MDREDVYIKTEKGAEEIQSRTYKLAQKMRSLLIMIDGTKSIGGLMDSATALGDVGSMLVALEEQGFIKKRIDAPKPRPAQQPQAAAPAPEPHKEAKKGAGDGALVDVASLFSMPKKDEQK